MTKTNNKEIRKEWNEGLFYLQQGRVIECGHCFPERYDTLEKIAEELKIENPPKCECICHDVEVNPNNKRKNYIKKSFHRQTLIGFLEQEIEMMEGMKISVEKSNSGARKNYRRDVYFSDEYTGGYNQALSDLITERRKLIEELKK